MVVSTSEWVNLRWESCFLLPFILCVHLKPSSHGHHHSAESSYSISLIGKVLSV